MKAQHRWAFTGAERQNTTLAQSPLKWDLMGPEGHLDLSSFTFGPPVFRFIVSNTSIASDTQAPRKMLRLPLKHKEHPSLVGPSVNIRCGRRGKKNISKEHGTWLHPVTYGELHLL